MIIGIARDISEDIKLKNELEVSYRKTRFELEAINFAFNETSIIAITDAYGKIKSVNQQFIDISKYSEAELIGQDHNILNSGYHPKEFFADLWKTIRGGQIWRGDIRNKDKEGGYYWVSSVIVPRKGEDGKIKEFVAIRQDITQKKKNEELLKLTKKELETLNFAFNETSIIAITDAHGKIKSVNQQFIDISKYSEAELIGKDHNILNSGYHSKEFFVDLWKTIRSGKIWRGDIRNKDKEGGLYWVSSVIVPRKGEDGKIIEFIAIRQDITENKINEELLKLTKKELEVINFAFNETSIIAITDAHGKIKSVNQQFIDISKYSEAELIGKDHNILNSGYHPKEFFVDLWKTIRSGKIWRGDIRNKDKEGGYYWVSSVIVPRKNEDGKIIEFVAIRQDITEKKENEILLQEKELENENQLLAINRSNACLIFNKDGIIEEVNDHYCELIGYDRDEIVGMNYNELIRQSDRSVEFDEILKKVTEGNFVDGEFRRITKSGIDIWLFASYNPLKDQNGKFERILKIAHDITDRKKQQIELTEAKELAEKSVKIKEQFLANMSHEIRTPLNGIIGFTDILTDTKLSDDQLELLDSIKTAGENLLVIINDILDFSKIEAEKMVFEQIDFSLSNTIVSVIDLLYPKAKGKNIKLLYDIEYDIPDVLIGDPTRLSQILINLIGNALKFTEKGYVEVLVKRIITDDEDVAIEFSIVDTGIGIAPDKMQTIFDSFTQASNDTSRKYGGTGLGLTITKRLIELQGGVLKIKSQLDKGSEFVFTMTFPVSDKKLIIEANEQNVLSPEFLKGKNILVAEDNPLNQRLIKKVFDNWKIPIDIADNGLQVLELLDKKVYSIILMDIQMPEMDGNETTKIIRKRNTKNKNIPIIALTAHARSGEKQRCLKIGMSDYLAKPFKRNELLQKIYDNIYHVDTQFVDSTEKLGGGPEANGTLINIAYLQEISDNDEVFIAEILEMFKSKTPEQLIMIEQCLFNHNYTELRRTVHKMKSSLGLVGVSSAEMLIERIELKLAKNESRENWIDDLDTLRDLCKKALSEVK